MDKYWSDKLAEELRPKLCAEQVEWFSFAHLSAALRKAKADGMREAGTIVDDMLGKSLSTPVWHKLQSTADRIERGEDA